MMHGPKLSESWLDRIHEAGLVPSLWPDVLSYLSKVISGAGASLFAIRDGYVSTVTSPNLAEITQEFMTEGWAERDPRLTRAAALNHAGFVNDGDILTNEEIDTNDVYANFYRKHGIGYMAGTLIPNPSGDSIGFAFQRHQDSGPVPRETIAVLDRLRPHLARASMIAFRLGFERARAQAEALQALNLPGAVLRGRGRVFAANGLFETLMPEVIQDRMQRIRMTDPAADALLAVALDGLSSGAGQSVMSIPVAAIGERSPMVLHIVPIRRQAHDLFVGGTALFVVTPVDRAGVPTAEVLQGLFDLTPAEARVARGIAGATSIDALATAQGVTRETVRSQLKAVLAKTGLNRQSELVSLLAGTARIG
jgi:DNA-binding CsgD family transcriptional regulator